MLSRNFAIVTMAAFIALMPGAQTARNNSCIEPPQRQVVTPKKGDTLWEIAQKTLIAGERTRARVGQIAALNGINPNQIIAGQTYLLRNGYTTPAIKVPDETNLKSGEPLMLNVGLEGFLCDAKAELVRGPYGLALDNTTRMIYWAPSPLQMGSYKATIRAEDEDVVKYRDFVVRAKVQSQTFQTADGIAYLIIPGADEYTPIISVDGKKGYALDMSKRVSQWWAQALIKDGGIEFALTTLYKNSGGIAVNNPVWLSVLDDLRTRAAAASRDGLFERFSYTQIDERENWDTVFPILVYGVDINPDVSRMLPPKGLRAN